MDEHAKVLLSALVGAAVGGLVGALYLTEGGRRVRRDLDPWLDEFIAELRRVRATADKARVAADEGWRAVEDMRRRQARQAQWQGDGYPRQAG